jgi:hypothetical protein
MVDSKVSNRKDLNPSETETKEAPHKKSGGFFIVNISPKRHLICNINYNGNKFSHHSHKNNLLAVYHQNIYGLGNKINELITFFFLQISQIFYVSQNTN